MKSKPKGHSIELGWHLAQAVTTAGKSIDSVASFEALVMKITYILAFSKPESLQ